MITDFAPSLHRPRRPRWRRNPHLAVTGLVAAVSASVLLGGNVYGSLSTAQPLHVRVHAGDSLWTIASQHYRSGDVRDHIDQIIALNRLGGSSITAGEDLLLPAP